MESGRTRPIIRDIRPVSRQERTWQRSREQRGKRLPLYVALSALLLSLLLASIVLGVMLGAR